MVDDWCIPGGAYSTKYEVVFFFSLGGNGATVFFIAFSAFQDYRRYNRRLFEGRYGKFVLVAADVFVRWCSRMQLSVAKTRSLPSRFSGSFLREGGITEFLPEGGVLPIVLCAGVLETGVGEASH